MLILVEVGSFAFESGVREDQFDIGRFRAPGRRVSRGGYGDAEHRLIRSRLARQA